eukprot:SAG11_NODE_26705_length_341_cov_102.826446_1_plen_24_part_10
MDLKVVRYTREGRSLSHRCLTLIH